MRRPALITSAIVVLACLVPQADAAPTAKQTLLAKVQPLANVLAAKRGWHITADRKTTTVSCSSFLGKTTCYGSVAVMFEDDDDPNTMAVGGWSATLVRSHGKWLVSKLHRSNLTVIS